MDEVVSQILEIASSAPPQATFLSTLFGPEGRRDRRVAIFGAGSLGHEVVRTLRALNIPIARAFDNAPEKIGQRLLDVPIEPFNPSALTDDLVLIASQRQSDSLFRQLVSAGISEDRILCKPGAPETNMLYAYCMNGSQMCIRDFPEFYRPLSIADIIARDADRIARCHELLSDKKSKELLVTKLALIASGGNLALLENFLARFSEPYREFGMFGLEGTTEDHYYFNNDVVELGNDEVFLDVGAFDGDTVETFVAACDGRKVRYGRIIAIEPDPPCYAKLTTAVAGFRDVECHCIGFGETEGTVKFLTSDTEDRFHVGIEFAEGNHEVQVVTLDKFLSGRRVTLIKMDPGANIIPRILRGARETISKQKPKLALGAYHSLEAIYEIPLLVHSFNPDYRMYLRHNTYHLADTDLFAIP